MFFIILFFNSLFLSLQGIPTGLFCFEKLTVVYLVEGGTPKKLRDGISSRIYNLDTVPGDLIRFTCLDGHGMHMRAGCFYIYDNCYYYEFDTNIGRHTSYAATMSFPFPDKPCTIKTYMLS